MLAHRDAIQGGLHIPLRIRSDTKCETERVSLYTVWGITLLPCTPSIPCKRWWCVKMDVQVRMTESRSSSSQMDSAILIAVRILGYDCRRRNNNAPWTWEGMLVFRHQQGMVKASTMDSYVPHIVDKLKSTVCQTTAIIVTPLVALMTNQFSASHTICNTSDYPTLLLTAFVLIIVPPMPLCNYNWQCDHYGECSCFFDLLIFVH